jgi:site-specific recombinase XerD
VRVNKTILLDLKDYLQNQNIKSGYIFRNINNNPLSTRTYQYIFDKYYFNELPFKPTPHTLRHSHIVLALKKGVPINAVQQNVGHMNLETTQIYCRLAGVDVANGYKNIEF